MAKASKTKFKDVKKKLKGEIASSIEGILKKLSGSPHTGARKLAKGAAAKVAKDFIKKLKKEDKAERPSAKRKPAKRTAARGKSASSKTVAKRPAARKTSPRRKPAVKKPTVKAVETPAPLLETSSEN
jgi:hypothetical protein